METPVYKFEPHDYDTVYEPAEDTFLLLDALEAELDTIKARQPSLCVEIGPGSGVVIVALSKHLPAGQTHCIGFDLNPNACRMTQKTAHLNGSRVDVVNMDLLAGLRPTSVDLLVFNPPYVPTQPVATTAHATASLEEHIDEFRSSVDVGQTLVHAWAGGADGRVVTDRVLADLPRVLSPTGLFYLLLLKENKPEEVLEQIRGMNLQGSIIKERRIRGEHLYVVRIERSERK
ncbi:methyltransferase N6AMT1 [Anopheles gambiae]|uniref:Methyltransferase HEMK2 n=1 Tax=Anopheles coluzzii TaxID=1518534 RepID=A0A6E8VZZ0_ANOCL|nr:methyltransferase N6AMT1 [Anopheles coluzzii]XP_307877.3 methyltransferase N6AMT1 [Anopheles gambiae]